MTLKDCAAVILAAGQGTRMKSALHKVLHPIGGYPMLFHLLDRLAEGGVSRQVLVLGAGREQVGNAVSGRRLEIAVQEPQLGTGHAVMAALPRLSGPETGIFVLYADTPLIPLAVLEQMVAALGSDGPGGPPAIVVLGFRPRNPGHYGRLITDADGALSHIVEYRDATAAERAVDLCNSGVMLFEAALLPDLLASLDNRNAKGEYYLTDCIAAARGKGRRIAVIEAQEDDVLGVNSRADLAAAEAVFQTRRRAESMEAGVTLIAPETVFFSHDTEIAADVTIEPHVVFGPGVRVASGAVIRAFSHIEGADVGAGAVIGPYARLRPGTVIENGARVGNFVEIKKARLGEKAKANHLAYIGDAEIGAGVNIGAGTITCNYDGFGKFRTEIGAGAFIGSNSSLVAPVRIGEGAIIGAGSVIVEDVESDALAIARAGQKMRIGWAKAFRSHRKAMTKKKPERND